MTRAPVAHFSRWIDLSSAGLAKGSTVGRMVIALQIGLRGRAQVTPGELALSVATGGGLLILDLEGVNDLALASNGFAIKPVTVYADLRVVVL